MDAHLVHMANDIATFHQALPEDEAIPMVADHINKFWAPSMRQKLFETFQEDPRVFNNLIAKSLLKINCAKYNPNKAEIRDKEASGG